MTGDIVTDLVDLGPCCACGGREKVTRMFFRNLKAPVPGTGWGCFVCGIPDDGAVVVVCEACDAAGIWPSTVCVGYPGEELRDTFKDHTEPFGHDMDRHRERPPWQGSNQGWPTPEDA